MATGQVDHEDAPLLKLCVESEADPAALPRILDFLQILNVVPRCVHAECVGREIMRVEVIVAGLSETTLALVAAKVAQVPCVIEAGWRRS